MTIALWIVGGFLALTVLTFLAGMLMNFLFRVLSLGSEIANILIFAIWGNVEGQRSRRG